jgi:release factor glutamine methyltransferase
MQAPLLLLNALELSTEYLASRGIETARLDAEVLLAHVLTIGRLELYLNFDKPLTDPQKSAYREMIRRRGAFEPVAYITGEKEFYSLDFIVTPDVFIPRPETELLVDKCLECGRRLEGGLNKSLRIFEIGTGCGAIAICLARELKNARIIANDVSEKALAIAAKNAERLEVSERILFIQGDLLGEVSEPLDIVVSNPPYVAYREREIIRREILEYEPAQAIFAGERGTEVIEKIIRDAGNKVQPGGYLLLEFGHGQRKEIERLLEATGEYDSIEVFADYHKIDRVVQAKKHG